MADRSEKAPSPSVIAKDRQFNNESPQPSDTDTATNSSDEFDWDNDDDDDDPKSQHEMVKAKRGRALWMSFMKLSRAARVLLVGTLGAAILITPFVVVKVRFKGNSASIQVHVWSIWLTVTWAAACGTYLVVDAIPRFILLVVNLFGGHVERLKLQIELVMAVSGWLKLALDISWAWIILSVIRTVDKPTGSYWVIINRVMQALFASSIILLVEKLFLQFVAINFHQKALAERLQENRLGLRALDKLSNTHVASNKRSPYTVRGQSKSPSASVDLLGSTPRGHKPQNSRGGSPSERDDPSAVQKNKLQKNIRARKNKAMTSIIVDQVGGAINAVALKSSRFNRMGEVGGLHSARRLARKLFSALSDVNPPRFHLVVEDFYPYFRTTSEAHDAFALFDKDGNGDISRREMREAVQRIYRERKSLALGLKDVSSVVAKLDAVLLTVALVVIIFVCLLIFSRTNTLSSLVPLATVILGFSFIFGHSAQTLFESVLYVREFGLFSTTFRRTDGQEIIAPNALLASTKLVHNLRRSKSMWETTKLTISYNTPLEIIEQIKIRINAYVMENHREWSGCGLNIDKMEYQNAITLIVAMEHRPNWQDWGGRWARRNLFMQNLKKVLEDLNVEYAMPVQPILTTQPFFSNGDELGNADRHLIHADHY
ncbi:hypothetical protein H0H93_011272 [Arthromyces matolae]|nr:hypothetical protein H0H93_011272 [Arthromyces matolae]